MKMKINRRENIFFLQDICYNEPALLISSITIVDIIHIV